MTFVSPFGCRLLEQGGCHTKNRVSDCSIAYWPGFVRDFGRRIFSGLPLEKPLKQEQTLAMTRKFAFLLLAEILTSLAVIGVFRTIPEKQVAALVAGTLFVGLGFYIVMGGFWDLAFRKSFSFVVGLIHLLATSVPMLSVRAIYYGEEFSTLSIWGLSGPTFHRLSEGVYLLLLIGTLTDLILSLRKKSSKA